MNKKNFYLYTASFIARNVATGAFLAIFNLYMVETHLSENFLGLFLSVGNMAMCLAGIPIGVLCDRYLRYKKQFLISFTIGLSMCLFMEATILNESLLILISILYGACFIGLTNLNNVYLIELKLGNCQNILVQNKSIGMAAYCVGTLLGGINSQLFSAGTMGGYRISLSIAAGIAVLSCVPLFFLSELYNDDKVEEDKSNSDSRGALKAVFREMVIPAGAFLCFGFAMLLNSYINLYLKDRFELDSVEISVFLILIQLGISFVVFVSAKYSLLKFYSKISFLTILLFIAFGCVKIETLPINIILIVLLFGVYNTLIPGLMESMITAIPSEYRNRSVSVFNMLYNLSESLGIYICGILLFSANYQMIFLTSFLGSAMGMLGVYLYNQKREGRL